jgi:hypothetical protein
VPPDEDPPTHTSSLPVTATPTGPPRPPRPPIGDDISSAVPAAFNCTIIWCWPLPDRVFWTGLTTGKSCAALGVGDSDPLLTPTQGWFCESSAMS